MTPPETPERAPGDAEGRPAVSRGSRDGAGGRSGRAFRAASTGDREERAASAVGPRPAPGLTGILVIAKPAGPTSHDVVALVRRLTGCRRVGHGGTLDPFASGVLPVFLGPATRMLEYHLADRKVYRAVVCFGARSTTDDLEGEMSLVEGRPPERAAIEALLPGFTGRVVQRPPDFSAVKVAGRRAYELARRGERLELREREIEIQRLDLLEWQAADPARPCATLEVACSAGTYIRSLARDLGAAAGSGGYLGALVRLASGPFRLEAALDLDGLRGAVQSGRLDAYLLPPDSGLDAYPGLRLEAGALASIARGQVVRLPDGAATESGPDQLVRILDADGRLTAMARLLGGRLHPDKVLRAPAGG